MRLPPSCLAMTVAALGAIFQSSGAAGAGAVLNVTVRVVDACSVTTPAGPPRGAAAGVRHRCTGRVPPHSVGLRPARARDLAPPTDRPGHAAIRRTRDAGREIVIVTVTY